MTQRYTDYTWSYGPVWNPWEGGGDIQRKRLAELTIKDVGGTLTPVERRKYQRLLSAQSDWNLSIYKRQWRLVHSDIDKPHRCPCCHHTFVEVYGEEHWQTRRIYTCHFCGQRSACRLFLRDINGAWMWRERFRLWRRGLWSSAYWRWKPLWKLEMKRQDLAWYIRRWRKGWR